MIAQQPETSAAQTSYTDGPHQLNLPDAVSQQLAVLKDSMYPSQREWAVVSLAKADWHAQPDALRALLAACREDPAATVRAACVRSFVRMQAKTPDVLKTIRSLKSDPDSRVKLEVEQALQSFAVVPATGMSHVASPDLTGKSR